MSRVVKYYLKDGVLKREELYIYKEVDYCMMLDIEGTNHVEQFDSRTIGRLYHGVLRFRIKDDDKNLAIQLFKNKIEEDISELKSELSKKKELLKNI